MALRPLLVCALALVAVAAIGWLDFVTGPEFGLSLFLAVPVFVAADRAGLEYGAAVALAAVGAWVAAHVLGLPAPPRIGLVAWNATVRAALFGVLVALAWMRRRVANERVVASTDPLTGIANRRALDKALAREMARVRRSGQPLTVAYIDCDDFKAINDRFGHETGDELLRTAAMTLASEIRSVDLAARIGGDEFAVLLIDVGADQAREVLERVRVALRDGMQEHGWPVTFSIGGMTTFDAPDTGDEVLERADGLMYRAKTGGKDALVYEIVGASSSLSSERTAKVSDRNP